jgi:sn-glycerol 3-phosphate transport system permease protein
VFPQRVLPMLLVLPQLAVVVIFFLWPTVLVVQEAFVSTNAFGLGQRFAGLTNFIYVLTSGVYGYAFGVTAVYAALSTVLSLALGLFIAVQVEAVGRGRGIYRTLFAWTYAVPAAVGGTLWLFLFNPQIGVGAQFLDRLGINWNFGLIPLQALAVVVGMTVWQQTAYNFLFFSAGLQAVPGDVLEAASLDGAGPVTRFWRMTFPLLSPTTFYLLVTNIILVFFYTFAIIDIITKGGPDYATETLVYKIYVDAFQNANTSIAAAQTVLLIVLVSALTAFQFRYFSGRVHYQ